MKLRFIAYVLAVLLCLNLGSFAQGPGQLNSGQVLSQNPSTGAYAFSWWGVTGKTYLIETSDDLVHWSYLPVVESGSNSVIDWGFTSSASSLFLKLEYISVPPTQLSGTALNGPIDPSSGLPEDWELFYFGQLGVNPSGYVSWSGSTVTNYQAYQNGYNPVDYYTGAVPSLNFPTGNSANGGPFSVLVKDQHGNPLIGAPVSFSIDYGGLGNINSSSYAQSVEALSGTDGTATVIVLPPWWPGTDYTVTAQALGQSAASIQADGRVGSDTPNRPAVPASPNQVQIPEPTIGVGNASTSVGNPAFEQYQPGSPPVKWYLTQTNTDSLIFYDSGPEGFAEWTGNASYDLINVVHPLFGGVTSSGASQYSDINYTSAGDLNGSDNNSGSFPAAGTSNEWSNTYTWSGNVALESGTAGQIGPENQSGPVFGAGDEATWGYATYFYEPYVTLQSQTTTQQSLSYYYSDGADNFTDFSEVTKLSNEYTSQQFQSDVIASLPAYTPWGSNYGFGGDIAWRHLASDNSSFAVASGTYGFSCLYTGTTPYKFEWYEAFQPDDNPATGYVGEQHITLTHQEWDNAVQQLSSQSYTIDPTTQQTNGVWYLANMDVLESGSVPAGSSIGCNWRHAIGAGEEVQLTLQGLPPDISGSAQWTVSPASAGTLQNINGTVAQTATGSLIYFTAGATAENATVTATLVGGATMATSFAITTPTGIAVTYISSEPFATGTIGAGMFVSWTLLPANVCFSNVLVSESTCNPVNESGFFVNNAPVHNPSGNSYIPSSRDVGLHDYNWISTRLDNVSNGADWASISQLSIETNLGFTQSGGFEWDIPFAWKLQSDTNNTNVLLFPNTVKATFNVTNNGTVTVTKVNASDTRSPDGSESHNSGP